MSFGTMSAEELARSLDGVQIMLRDELRQTGDRMTPQVLELMGAQQQVQSLLVAKEQQARGQTHGYLEGSKSFYELQQERRRAAQQQLMQRRLGGYAHGPLVQRQTKPLRFSKFQ